MRKTQAKSLPDASNEVKINQRFTAPSFHELQPRFLNLKESMKAPNPDISSDNMLKRMVEDSAKSYIGSRLPDKDNFDEMEEALFRGK